MSVSLNIAARCSAVFPSGSTASMSTPNFARGDFPPIATSVSFGPRDRWRRLRHSKSPAGLQIAIGALASLGIGASCHNSDTFWADVFAQVNSEKGNVTCSSSPAVLKNSKKWLTGCVKTSTLPTVSCPPPALIRRCLVAEWSVQAGRVYSCSNILSDVYVAVCYAEQCLRLPAPGPSVGRYGCGICIQNASRFSDTGISHARVYMCCVC